MFQLQYYVKIKAMHAFLARYQRFQKKKAQTARHYVGVTLRVLKVFNNAQALLI